MKTEKEYSSISGYTVAFVLIILNLFGIGVTAAIHFPIFIILFGAISFACIPGFFLVNPNNSVVLVMFGEYQGTVKESGFHWVNPFFSKRSLSLRAQNLESDKIKVNDKVGNPIQIGVILVWQVQNTYKAAFDIDNYEKFVKIQVDAAVRTLAGLYPYDNFDNDGEITLRSGHNEVNKALEETLKHRLEMAGINVIEARIGNLAYAPEIAGAMLRRQQAAAVVAARFKIVEGAVSMVQMALEHLSAQKIVDLDEERKAAMVSNLMVVLCGDKDVSPVINAGTLNQ